VRVISGSAKGRRLKPVPGSGTRPITDRAKTSLFNILGGDIAGARVLDLFAGTGGVGIEALSRGAGHAVFVDAERVAVNTILANLQLTGLRERATVVRADVFRYLTQPPGGGYHYIHIAPPQFQGLWLRTLRLIDARPDWLDPDGVAVVQVHPKEYQPPELAALELTDERRYGSTALYFFQRPI
jgi:16S rRNA (guanine(966)-N(2))-methyltransferase RsmD